jgi:hypothetical protein
LLQALEQSETPEALEGVGRAYWWLDEADAVRDARERAYRLYRERGDVRGAARVALELAEDALIFRAEEAVFNGWTERARRLLEGAVIGTVLLAVLAVVVVALVRHVRPAAAVDVQAEAASVPAAAS